MQYKDGGTTLLSTHTPQLPFIAVALYLIMVRRTAHSHEPVMLMRAGILPPEVAARFIQGCQREVAELTLAVAEQHSACNPAALESHAVHRLRLHRDWRRTPVLSAY